MLYPEYSQSKKAEQNSIVSKYHLDKQKENKFDSVTPQQAENIKQLASVYSFAPAGLVSTLGKNGYTVKQAEPYILSYVNNFANDGRTIRNDARDYQLSNAGVFSWMPSPVDTVKKSVGQTKKFAQVFSTGLAAYPQFVTRLLRTYMIARNAGLSAMGVEDENAKANMFKAFVNPVFMKEFLNQIKPEYIGQKKDLTKDFVPFFEGGPAFEKAGPSALTVGYEQFGEKFFDLDTPGTESGLGNSWFPYFGSGSEAWDESNRRGKLYAQFRGSAFSPTTGSQPVTPGGLVAGEIVDANTQSYTNISGFVDGVLFLRGDLGNKLGAISASTIGKYKNWGLIKETTTSGKTIYRNVDRDKAFNYFMKSDDGGQIMKAWSENLDDVNEIVKRFTPPMAQDLIRASKFKNPEQKLEAVKTAFQRHILQDPKGMPDLPAGYKWNKIPESIGLNKIFKNLSPEESKKGNRLWGDWTPKNTFVWQNQEDVIENTRRFIVNSRIPKTQGDKLLASFVNATLQNTNQKIGYVNQKKVFNKIIDAAAEAMEEAKERPDVIESFLDITKGNLRGFNIEDISSYWKSDILSWHKVKESTNKALLGVEGIFPGQRARLDDLGNELIINGQKQKAPTPHLPQQLLSESITIPDMRKIRNSTSTISKVIRNIELTYGKKIAQGIDNIFDKDLVDTNWFEKSRFIDTPRLATRSLINILWGVQKSIWTPLQLITRIAFPVRITMDGQAKLASDGYPSLTNNMGEYFGLLLGKNNRTLKGEVLTKTEEFGKVSRDNTRLYFGENTLENLKQGYLDYTIEQAFESSVGKKNYLQSVIEEIKLLNLGTLTNQVADNLLKGVNESTLARRLWNGDLNNIRLQYNKGLLDNDMMPGNALSTYNKTKAYVDTLYQRVKEVTNDPDVLKFIASGKEEIQITNSKGIKENLRIIDVPQGSTIKEMGLTLKRMAIDDQKFYKYIERKFDDVAPLIKQELASTTGNPVFQGFPLIQQGRPSIKIVSKEGKAKAQKFLDAAITALFEFPAGVERSFNRSPLYRTIRSKSLGDAYFLMTDDLKKEFVASLNKLPKLYSKILKDDSFISQGFSKFFDTDALNKSTKQFILDAIEESKGKKPPAGAKLFETLDEVEQYADARALFMHNNLLFNLSERGYFADVTRLMYPFMGAWIEQVSTWTGVLSRNPFAIRTAGLVVNGGQEAGYISEGPNGEKYFTYPWIGPAQEEKYFNDQNNKLKIDASSPLEAVNMVTANFGPGAGPYLQIPAGLYIPDTSEFDMIQKHFNPFGVKVTDAETLKKFGATYLLPAYMVKLITAWSKGEGVFADQYLWNTHLAQTAKALAVTGFYINKAGEKIDLTNDAGAIDQKKLLEAAQEVGTQTLLVRGAYQGGLPSGFTYDYRLRTEGETLNDYKEFFGEDVELGIDGEGYIRFSAVTSLYVNMKALFKGDDEAAIVAMTEMLGPDWLKENQGIEALTYITKGTSYNEAGIRSTTEQGYNWERDNAELEKYISNVFGLFAPAPEVGADYSYEAAFNQRRKGNTYKLSADEWLVEVNKINGSRMYSYLTTLEEIEKGRPLTKKERGDTFYMVDSMFPNFYVKSITIGADIENWNQMELAVGIEVKNKEALPNSIRKQIQESPLYKPLKEYMDYREKILIEIAKVKDVKNKYGTSGNNAQYYLKKTNATQAYRNELIILGERLAKESAEFAIFWNFMGSKELKEEYYEDIDRNFISLLEEIGR
tara:strand:+ start:453 stop:5639 length:5187 start_codon:yes stop_codon:yes gene_type:complete